jgi:hypothetical protein
MERVANWFEIQMSQAEEAVEFEMQFAKLA